MGYKLIIFLTMFFGVFYVASEASCLVKRSLLLPWKEDKCMACERPRGRSTRSQIPFVSGMLQFKDTVVQMFKQFLRSTRSSAKRVMGTP